MSLTVTTVSLKIPQHLDEKYPHVESGYGDYYFKRKMINLFTNPSKVFLSDKMFPINSVYYSDVRALAIIWNELPSKIRRMIGRFRVVENITGIETGSYNRFNKAMTIDPLTHGSFDELYRVVQHEIGHCIEFTGKSILSNNLAEEILTGRPMTRHLKLDTLESYGEKFTKNGTLNPRWRYELFAETHALWIREHNGMEAFSLFDADKYKAMKKALEPRFLEVYG